jgi:hypothetical protein
MVKKHKVKKHKRKGYQREDGTWVKPTKVSEHYRKNPKPKLDKKTKTEIIKGKVSNLFTNGGKEEKKAFLEKHSNNKKDMKKKFIIKNEDDLEKWIDYFPDAYHDYEIDQMKEQLEEKGRIIFDDELFYDPNAKIDFNYRDFLKSSNPVSFEYLLNNYDEDLLLTEEDHPNINGEISIFEYYGIDPDEFRNYEDQKKEIIDILVKELGESEARDVLDAHRIRTEEENYRRVPELSDPFRFALVREMLIDKGYGEINDKDINATIDSFPSSRESDIVNELIDQYERKGDLSETKRKLWILDDNILEQIEGWEKHSKKGPQLNDLKSIIEGADPKKVSNRIVALQNMDLVKKSKDNYYLTKKGKKLLEE